MIGSIGFGYIDNIERVGSTMIEKLRNVDTSNITDAQNRTGTMNPRIKPINSESRILGSALTVDLPLGDNLMLYVALKIAKPGDVLIINTSGNNTKSVWGELMTQSALSLKLGGVVIDGFIRDLEANKNRGLPIFCCGSVPVSVEKNGPGFVNGEISCGDISVLPGDIIVGDGDGVVVIKKENLPMVFEKIKEIEKREEKRNIEISNGKILPSWLDKKMEKIGRPNI